MLHSPCGDLGHVLLVARRVREPALEYRLDVPCRGGTRTRRSRGQRLSRDERGENERGIMNEQFQGEHCKGWWEANASGDGGIKVGQGASYQTCPTGS